MVKKSSSKPPDPIALEDATLFRAAVGAVQPLAEQNRVEPYRAPRRVKLNAVVPGSEIPDTLSDFSAEAAPDTYLSNGLSRMTLRKLKRGAWPIQDRLDLHGHDRDAARRLLQEFLYEAQQQSLRCVLVIHGKGMNSQHGEGILRKLTRHWLIQHAQVLAYCDAPAQEGGSGAALLLLRAMTENPDSL